MQQIPPVGSGVMFVVDSSDPGRLEEAKRTLLEVVGHEQLKGVPWEGDGIQGDGGMGTDVMIWDGNLVISINDFD